MAENKGFFTPFIFFLKKVVDFYLKMLYYIYEDGETL